MSTQFYDATAPTWSGQATATYAQFPHGLVVPPPEIREQVAKQKAKVGPNFDSAYEELTLDDWTLAYYYEGIFVAYRSVPEGVEVLAVGDEEVGKLVQKVPKEKRLGVTFTVV
ncbi:MAG TPA: hypothetical protein VE988_29485 [Gemmataceae bacterium]|nr:hypothetical protein [Gemmataceae bacterium]